MLVVAQWVGRGRNGLIREGLLEEKGMLHKQGEWCMIGVYGEGLCGGMHGVLPGG